MHLLAVHLTPALVDPSRLAGGIVIVVDILRATTTIVHALAAGAEAILAVADVAEAHQLADSLGRDRAILAGERGGKKIDGFDLGNSPAEFTPSRCAGRVLVFTTTNGTRAILHAQQAERILVGAFTNFSAVCQEALQAEQDVHILCAGTEGHASLEDTVFAGAVVHVLMERGSFAPTDGARIAWDSFEGHGQVLRSTFEVSAGGQNLIGIGMVGDLSWAARVDRFGFVPEAVGLPPEIRLSAHRWEERHWNR